MVFTSPLSASPYDVLGVNAAVSDDELRRAYRLRLRQTHPDTGGEAAEFIQVQQAWEILADPASRARYDGGSGTSYAPAGGAKRTGSRLGSKVFGTAGSWRRARYAQLAQEHAGDDAEVYSASFVRSAPWELRELLADALAEEATAAVTDRMGIGFTVWHGVDLSEEGTLDHVALGHSGLYALTSIDLGGPVKFRQGEPITADPSATPVADLLRRVRILARAARVKFSGAIVIFPDDDLSDVALALGEVRGLPVIAVRRSALPLVLRGGIPGARTIGGNEVFDVRTRLSGVVRVR